MFAATSKQPADMQSQDVLDPVFMERYIASAKAAWRAHAQHLSWEEKIASIEKMWARDKALKASRESSLQKLPH